MQNGKNVVFCLLVLFLYYLIRYFLGSFAIPLLILLAVYLIYPLGVKGINFVMAALFFPLLLALTSLFGSDPIAAKYFLFEAFALLTICITPFNYSENIKSVRLIALLFLGVCAIFAAFPQLERASTLSQSLGEAYSMQYVVEDTHGFRAFFYDSGECGLFSAAMVLAIVGCRRATAEASTAIDLALIILLIGVVLASHAATPLVLLVLCGMWLFCPLWASTSSAVLALVAIVALQRFFGSEVSGYLGSGSTAWRFQMADIVINSAAVFSLSPQGITELPNWPHSMFLDMCVGFGLSGSVAFIVMVIFICWSDTVTKLPIKLAFFLCACVMPCGAGPVFWSLGLAGSMISFRSRQEEQKLLAESR